MDNIDKNLTNNANTDFDIMKYLKNYLKNWKWFVISCLLCGILAFFYIRYTQPEYNAYAKIMILEDDNSNAPASAILEELNKFSETKAKSIEDEIEVLKSRKLMAGVIDRLSINIELLNQGRIYNTPIYPKTNAPIKVNFIASDSVINNSRLSFVIEITSETTFNYKLQEKDIEHEYQKFSFGQNIVTPIGGIVVIPNPSITSLTEYIGNTIIVNINPVNSLAESYKEKIIISQVDEFSKVVGISLNDAVKERAQQIINTLIDEYNNNAIEEKNQKAKNTAEFIDERVNLIATDLAEADNKIEQFKTGNKLTDITSEADMYLSTSASTEQEMAETRTQLNLVNYMKDYVDGENGGSFEFIPSNVGMSDESINNLTSKYNDLLRERNSLLSGSTKEKNPIIVNLDQQLVGLRQSLSQSLDNSTKSIRLKLSSLQNQSDKINSKIFAVPGQARKSRDIEREQGTKESLYLYLLQKREEATISLASTSPSVKIIDTAYSPQSGPVSPNRMIIYLASIIIGLCIPFSFIYVKDLLDNKIHNKEDLQQAINDITILGEIPKIKAKKINSLVEKHDRSLLSESFRIIRTNFDYVKRGRNVKEYNNVVFVTSTINGEGKSFFSMNFALTLANTDKRVLLIGADIRNPKTPIEIVNQKKKNKTEIGLTEYLIDESIIVGSAINTYEINGNHIDVLLSGKVPPNPAELLMSDRMKLLFDKVSGQYDYVIVDTAPSMLVTDTLLFSHYAGHTIYMTRADYTEKRILNFAKELHAENRLNGMMLVVNDVKESNFGYGAKYGYYGAQEKKNLFKRIFS